MASPGAAPLSFAKQAEAYLKRLRKWDTEFLCVGTKKEAFSVPKPDEAIHRMQANLDYFLVNYMICSALLTLIAIVIYPQLLVLVCVFSGLWYGLLTRPSNFKIQMGAALIAKKQAGMILAGFNAIIVLVFARTTIFATIGAAFLFVLGHACFHSVPAKHKSANASEEANEP